MPLLAALAAALAAPAGDVSLDRAAVPARGREEAVLTVARYGRYALSATSPQGTAVQLVDRMAGPGEVAGAPGGVNGRVDVFLDRGTYKLVALSDKEGTGQARLDARAFAEQNGEKPPLLEPLREVDAPLDDLQQRSYWVRVDGPLHVEAVGRALADLRLWRDGKWLDAATPVCEEVEPAKGKPQTACRLDAEPEPGLYQLVAYGGRVATWAETDAARPFWMRMGIPPLPSTSRAPHVVGPGGVDRWLVAAGADTVRVELPEARPLDVAVRAYEDGSPFEGGGSTGRITKDSLPPAVNVSVAKGKPLLVTVTGAAGQPYVLQTFDAVGRAIPLSGNGVYFLTTLQAAPPGDEADATGVVVDDKTGKAVAWQAIPLAAPGYRRRFNLLGPVTLLLEAKEAGTWEIATSNVAAHFVVEPFVVTPPEGYQPPPAVAGSGRVDIGPGLWKLTLTPDKKGVVELTMRPSGWGERVKDAVGMGGAVPETPPMGAVQLPALQLAKGQRQTLYLGEQPGVPVGYVLRQLPPDLVDALPILLDPGREFSLKAKVSARGVVAGAAEDGRKTEVSVDGGPWAASERVEAGEHEVRVRQGGPGPVRVSLGVTPDERRRGGPLPALPDEEIAGLPAFPVLTAAAPAYLDLGVEEARTYQLTVDKPAMYRFESTGLLATAGTVRTRIVPEFASAEQNGVGRNFLVATYLREGDYQVTVRAQGKSAGHLGLRLVRTDVRDGGTLAVGIPARAALPADTGIAWRFHVAEEGDYTLRSFGPGRDFRLRLEDGDGWPLLPPDTKSPIAFHFLPGDYRLVGLPEADDTVRITTLERAAEPVVRKGHGPFPLPLETTQAYTWWEPAQDGGARTPDTWTFTVPAPADLTVSADAEMTGTLSCDGKEVGRLAPGRPFTGRVGPASCELALTNARRNSGVAYNVSVVPDQLVAGVTRTVRAPIRLPVSVGTESLIDLSSFGGVDVRARLYDATGTLVAGDDDRPEDWNFEILRRLQPGLYTLRIDPVGGPQADCAVTMRAAGETTEAPLALGEAKTLVPGEAVRTFPLQPPADGLLVVTARSTENVGLAVEASDGKGWRTLDSRAGNRPRIEVRLGAPGLAYRARLWSLDRRGVEATLRADAGTPKRPPEGALRAGVVLGGEGVVAVPLDRAGTFTLATTRGLRVCPAPGDACREPDGATISGDDALWITGAVGTKVQAKRVIVGDDAVRVRIARPVTVDLEGKGPVVAWATADGGQPGVRVGEAGEPMAPAGGMAVGQERALAVSLASKKPVALVWSADGEADEALLARATFAAPAVETAAWGDLAGQLEAGKARSFALPTGARTVRLALDAGLVAVLGEGDVAGTVHWAAEAPLAEAVAGAPGRLTVLNPTSHAAAFTVEVAHGGEPVRLAAGTPVERAARAAGITRVDVAAETGALHVRGGDATFSRADGTVATGNDLVLDGRAGVLDVRHGTGAWLAWIDRPGEEDRALWGKSTPTPAPTPVAAPTEVALAGAAQRLTLDAPSAGLVRLRASGPMVALVRRGQGSYEPRLVDGALDLAVPAGPVEIALRGLAGVPLSGLASVSFDPAVDTGEGLGPEVVVPAGGARVFRFTTDREAPVGLGVRADAADVEATLYDANGAEVGRGVVILRTLPKGTWLYAVSVPPGAAPARARPAVVGLVPPDTGPPAEVVRSYLVAAGLIPPPPEDEEPEGADDRGDAEEAE